MMGLNNLGWLYRCWPRMKKSNGIAYADDRVASACAEYSVHGYESPRLTIIGSARKSSTGSSSSGKADANSQYYW